MLSVMLQLKNSLIFLIILKISLPVESTLRSKRIVNGLEAVEGQAPFIVSLQIQTEANTTEHFCTGSYLGNGFVITASHCLKSIKACDVKLKIGKIKLGVDEKEDSDEGCFSIEGFCRKRFDEYTFYNDVALLKVDSRLDKLENSRLKLLSSYDVDVVNCKIFGFGASKFGGDYSKKLLVGAVELISNSECQKILGSVISPDYNQGLFCAKGIRGVDACGGDSGGALVCEANNDTYLLGVVSYGVGCGSTAGVYTNVIHHFDWIKKVTGLDPDFSK